MNIFNYNEGRIGVRPEDMLITEAPTDISGIVDIVEELGAESYVYVTVGNQRFVARADKAHTPQRGDSVHLSFDPNKAHHFDPETGERINS